MSMMRLAREEREEFADLLESLTPEQWDVPSLCTRWRVQEVVAHVVSYEELGLLEVARRLVRGRLVPDRANAIGVHEYASRPREELIGLLRRPPAGLTALGGGAVALVDGLIHQQDVRRPLGLSRTVAEERMVPALRLALFAPVVGGIVRARDVRLVATDLDWTFGRGPEVHGSAEALLMTIAGRRDAVGELAGPGRETLERRVGVDPSAA